MGTSYLVCATPRSGSTLLCEGLKATGVGGRPEEYFEAVPATGRPPRPEDFLEGLEDREAAALIGDAAPPDPPPYSSLAGIGSYDEHLCRVREWGSTHNGVFAAKLMWDHVGHLEALTGGGRAPLELLNELFGGPRFVWVRREDAVRQAVSLWRALQTQSWRDEGGGSPRSEPRYCFAALRHLVGRLTAQDAQWGALLAGSPVLAISYEELTADLPAAIARALRHAGVEPPAEPPALPAMRRQADELSEAWVAAYERDAAAVAGTEPLPAAS